MPDPTKLIDKAMDIFDDKVSTDKTREDIRTDRAQIDSTSPFKLPHLIRPISFIWAMGNETILTWSTIVLVFFGNDIDPNAVNTLMVALAANTAILTTIVGFYFNSRKIEKINAKKADATLKLEAMKTKHELREDKRDSRAERKEERKK